MNGAKAHVSAAFNGGDSKLGKKPYLEVIGDPIDHSKSPLIHGFWLKQAGIEMDYRAHHVEGGGAALAEYLNVRRDDPAWRGCNVTMPHKQMAVPLLDHLDPLAARLGAVNTIVRQDDGSLRGFNTDVAGFLEPLNVFLGQNHLFRMARIMGAGGAARAIIAGLSDHNMVLIVAARDPGKAEQVLADLVPMGEYHTPPLGNFAEPTDFAFDDREGCFDLIVNTTPLGMRGQAPLQFDFSHAPPGSVVYDIVTDPLETDFLQRAQAAGFQTIDGLSMLIGQAAAAFNHFLGVSPPRDKDDQLRRILFP